MKPKLDCTLYLVTDRSLMSAATLEEAVEQAILGGCTLVQLREKEATSRAFYELAGRVKQVTDRHGVPLIINDRVDIALAADAAGVHLGQKDMPAKAARALLGRDRLLGVSAATVAEACQAEADGADYLGVGAMFQTGTKSDTRATPMATLLAIRAAVSLPMVAIGGVNGTNVAQFSRTGVEGVAVVSAVLAQTDIRAAAEGLKKQILAW